MKVIIAGSRDIHYYEFLLDAIKESCFDITHVVSGGAKGVDALAERYAKENELPITIYYAQWKKCAGLGYPKAAGAIRNKQMAEESGAEALIAVHNGTSPGTVNMLWHAERLSLKIYKKIINKEENNAE